MQADAGGAGAMLEAGRGEAVAIAPRCLPAGLPLAIAVALTNAPSGAEGAAPQADGASAEGAHRLLLLAPGPELVILDIPGDEARPNSCQSTAQT